jgi:U3 small nucleolar RNA-associated protein 19
MLALNGIFILMTQHSLEYPQFYNRLYQVREPLNLEPKPPDPKS